MPKTLFKSLLAQPPTAGLPPDFTIYGAGNMGRKVGAVLKQKGLSNLAWLDRSSAPGKLLDGVAVHTAKEWLATDSHQCKTVIVAVHNPGHSVPTLVKELEELGFGPVITLMDLANLYPDDFGDSFWLAPRSQYVVNAPQVERLYDLLADHESREVLSRVLSFRIGSPALWQEVVSQNQYHPHDLPRWPEPMKIVDCGAYTGDTLEALIAAGYAIAKAACFEPDPANFSALVDTVRRRGIDGICLPCAVSDANTILRFSAAGTSASKQAEDGESSVQAVRLDDALPSFGPNLIKMDIEGAEMQALAGAREMLEKYRPCFGISVYHQADHLWDIPLTLNEWLPDYSFYLRAHAFNTFELVMYAYPNPETVNT